MRLIVAMLALAALPFPALAQEQANDLVAMHFAHGTCQKLVTPDGDQTAQCNQALVFVSYLNGRHSFWFSIPKKSLIAFSGLKQSEAGAVTTLQLDLLSIADDPKAIRSTQGTGICTSTDLWNGVAHVHCEATSGVGKFMAEFTTDGQTPEGTGPH